MLGQHRGRPAAQPGQVVDDAYGADHWYFQWGAFTFTGLLGGVGIIYYLFRLRGRPAAVLAEHRSEAVLPGAGAVADEPA